MKIAVVGATGLVGSKMLQVLDEQKVRIDELVVAASERSVGKEIVFQGKTYKVVSVDEAIAARPDIAIFSAGATASRQYAPRFAEKRHLRRRQQLGLADGKRRAFSCP